MRHNFVINLSLRFISRFGRFPEEPSLPLYLLPFTLSLYIPYIYISHSLSLSLISPSLSISLLLTFSFSLLLSLLLSLFSLSSLYHSLWRIYWTFSSLLNNRFLYFRQELSGTFTFLEPKITSRERKRTEVVRLPPVLEPSTQKKVITI